MPKATKSSDSATTKKRSRKTSPENGKDTHATESVTTSPGFAHESPSSPALEEKIRAGAYGKGTQAAEPVTTSPEFAQESRSSLVLEEKIRAGAYGKGTQAAAPVPTSPEFAQESQSSPTLEEKIRARAYELYLQRGGTGGSPEQDWLRAREEVCGR